MPYFCIYDHTQLPITMVVVKSRRKDHTKDGFRLRYVLSIAAEMANHADDVIHRLDHELGTRTKAHGYYQANYDDVRAAYDAMLAEAAPEPRLDWSGPLQAAALIAAVALTVAMCVIIPPATLLWLFVSALKSQSGLTAMAESAVVWSIFDWRPLTTKLFHYSRTGIWPR